MLRHVEWIDRYGEGRIAIRLSNDYVVFKKIHGKNLAVEYLHAVLDAAIPGWRQRGEELHLARKHPWRIDVHRGTSGCRDFTLRYLRDEWLYDAPVAARIHVSMFGKIERFEVWLGDLVPLAAEIGKTYSQVDLPDEEEYGRFWVPTQDGGYLKIRIIEPRPVEFNEPGTPSGLFEEHPASTDSQAPEEYPEEYPEVEVV